MSEIKGVEIKIGNVSSLHSDIRGCFEISVFEILTVLKVTLHTGLQIRSNKDNLGIIIHISSEKHIF